MAYNSNIPQPTDQLSVSQGDLLANFQALATILNPNTGSATFINQVAAPTFPANQLGLYALTPALTSVSELFVSKNSAAGKKEIPLTASILSTSTPGNGGAGWTYLPSGIILQWGGYNTSSGSAVNFPIPFPTQPLNVVVTPINPSTSGAQGAANYTTTKFDVFQAGANPVLGRFFAIGY